jgi:Tol biopolymer transport system component
MSRDGQWAVCHLPENKLAAISVADGRLMRMLPVSNEVTDSTPFLWTPDGKSIANITTHQGVSNLVAQSSDGGQLRQLTNFASGLIFSFDWSRDGKLLACARGSISNDVIGIHSVH